MPCLFNEIMLIEDCVLGGCFSLVGLASRFLLGKLIVGQLPWSLRFFWSLTISESENYWMVIQRPARQADSPQPLSLQVLDAHPRSLDKRGCHPPSRLRCLCPFPCSGVASFTFHCLFRGHVMNWHTSAVMSNSRLIHSPQGPSHFSEVLKLNSNQWIVIVEF